MILGQVLSFLSSVSEHKEIDRLRFPPVQTGGETPLPVAKLGYKSPAQGILRVKKLSGPFPPNSGAAGASFHRYRGEINKVIGE